MSIQTQTQTAGTKSKPKAKSVDNIDALLGSISKFGINKKDNKKQERELKKLGTVATVTASVRSKRASTVKNTNQTNNQIEVRKATAVAKKTYNAKKAASMADLLSAFSGFTIKR
jgi:hypothetical protein